MYLEFNIINLMIKYIIYFYIKKSHYAITKISIKNIQHTQIRCYVLKISIKTSKNIAASINNAN